MPFPESVGTALTLLAAHAHAAAQALRSAKLSAESKREFVSARRLAEHLKGRAEHDFNYFVNTDKWDARTATLLHLKASVLEPPAELEGFFSNALRGIPEGEYYEHVKSFVYQNMVVGAVLQLHRNPVEKKFSPEGVSQFIEGVRHSLDAGDFRPEKQAPWRKYASFMAGKPLFKRVLRKVPQHEQEEVEVRVAASPALTKALAKVLPLYHYSLLDWHAAGKSYLGGKRSAEPRELFYPRRNRDYAAVTMRELPLEGGKQKFAVKEVNIQRLKGFTEEAVKAHQVATRGVLTPKFHGFAQQKGALLAFYEHVEGTPLLNKRFDEELVRKFARYIAERHSKGVVQEDAALRNTILGHDKRFWMIDHEKTWLDAEATHERKRGEVEALAGELDWQGPEFKREYSRHAAKLAQMRLL